MSVELKSIQDSQLDDTTTKIISMDEKIQSAMVGLGYFKLHYPSHDSYEVSQIACLLSSSWSGKDISSKITAILQDDDHSISLEKSKVSLSAMAVTGDETDYSVRVGTISNVNSGEMQQKICANASEPIHASGVALSGINMVYDQGKNHRFWKSYAQTVGNDVANDGLYGAVTGDMRDDSKNVSTENQFNLVGFTTSSKADPSILVKSWTGQSPYEDKVIDFKNSLKPGYILDSVAVFLSDYKVAYGSRSSSLASLDHEITAFGAGCSSWSIDTKETNKKVNLVTPHAFVYQDGFGDDKQDNSESSVSLLIVASQKPE